MAMDNWAQRYASVLEGLNASNLQSLDSVLDLNIDFRDPFNHTISRDLFKRLLEDMYAKLDHVEFKVKQVLSDKEQGMIVWTFSAESRLTGKLNFDGMSHLLANEQGMVIAHHDYWDGSALMANLPVAGHFVRFLRKKLRYMG